MLQEYWIIHVSLGIKLQHNASISTHILIKFILNVRRELIRVWYNIRGYV